MNKSRKFFSLEEGKTQASILLKSLQSADEKIAHPAARRFQALPEFSKMTVDELAKHPIKHKHALNVIAIENGFHSWTDLKMQTQFIIGGHLNHWFPTYEAAKSHQKSQGGFLFPYKNQFFICNAHYVQEIGFDPNDKNWEVIDFDWAKPANIKAWQALHQSWSASKKG